MAVSKVILNGVTQMDVTDTTADASEVLSGEDFYLRNGVKSTGTLQVVNPASIANTFSTSSTYAVGDYVLYEGSVYQCNTAITTAGAWDSSKWDAIVLADELNEVTNGTLALSSSLVTTLESGTDFNTLTDGASYKIGTAAAAEACPNCPRGTAGRLIVLQTSMAGRIVQIYVSNGTPPQIFMRYYSGSTFYSWVQLATSDAYVSNSVLYQYNAFNALDLGNGSNRTHNGITYTKNDDGTWTIDGTATDLSFANIISSSTSFPSYIVPGRKYKFKFNGGTVPIKLYTYYSSSEYRSIDRSEDFEVEFPSYAVGLILRLNIPSGASYSNEVIKYEFVPEVYDCSDNLITDILSPIDDIGYINDTTGDIGTNAGTKYDYTDYIDISGYSSILYRRIKSTNSSPASGLAFYDSSKTYIEGERVVGGQEVLEYHEEIRFLGVPSNAKYARFTVLHDTTTYGDFSLRGTRKLSSVGSSGSGSSIIPKGACDSTSTATVFIATVPGVTELRDGVCIWLTNGVITSASGCTLNVNGLGAKPLYSSQAASTAVTTQFNVAYTALLVFNSTRVSGGCWDYVYGYDTNTTYTPQKLGFGYGTCTTTGTTVAKVATLSSYVLNTNGMVSIKFANAVCANATLNVNSKGAKAIYYRGAAITDGIIKAGDIATFVYSTNYHLIAIDRAINSASDIEGLASAIKNVPNCDLLGIAGFTDYYYIDADGVETVNIEFKHTKVIPCLPNHTYKLTATSVSANAGWYIRTHAYIDGVWSRQLAVTNVLSAGGQSIEQNVTLSATENGITVSYIPARLADAPVLVDSTISSGYHDIYWATYGVTTFNEVYNALSAGKLVMAYDNGTLGVNAVPLTAVPDYQAGIIYFCSPMRYNPNSGVYQSDIYTLEYEHDTWNALGSATMPDSSRVAVNQGTANAGKFLVVGSNGDVTPVAMSAWQGGNY